MTTAYISIGNSDDKLSQLDWSLFVDAVDNAVSRAARFVGTQVHGRWHSLPTEPWQNACWCLTIAGELPQVRAELREDLAAIADQYRQDSIAWAEATTEFIQPGAPKESTDA